jgi:tetratricopeptide (TPR) repeat protein
MTTEQSTHVPARFRWTSGLLTVLLVVATVVAYWRVCGNDFISYDDPIYVVDNPEVKKGLTADSITWSFTSTYAGYWQPLTWLSFQLDQQIFGPAPWGYHFTNLLLHVANTVLLFWAFLWMTGAVWPSFVVAAFFALHPLHVESVAWVTERKDVLSTLFWMLTLLAYVKYARRPGLARYLLVLSMFVLGLMAKPMLVTLPCVLLLLDYWPLARFSSGPGPAETEVDRPGVGRSLGRLVAEKLPFFAISAILSVTAFRAQHASGGVMSLEGVALPLRMTNALAAYAAYMGTMVWPSRLALYYPYPRGGIGWWQVGAAVVLLGSITVVAVLQARRRPYLLVGWLWFLGTLVPVSGLVQIGGQARADRFTYVPLVGLFIMLAWGIEDLGQRISVTRPIRIALSAILIGCLLLTWRQVGYWRNSETIWLHSAEVIKDHYIAELSLSVIYEKQGNVKEGLEHSIKAVRIRPDPAAHVHISNLFLQQGHLEEAKKHCLEALRLQPDSADAYTNLGIIYSMEGKAAPARAAYSKALEIDPRHAGAHWNLGQNLLLENNYKEAVLHFEQVLQTDPGFDKAYDGLGDASFYQGQIARAVTHYSRAVTLAPTVARYHYDLACALTELGNMEDAKKHYTDGKRLDPQWPQEAAQQAWQLARHPDQRRRHAAMALQLAKEACGAVDPPPAQFLLSLAAAYEDSGQVHKAADTARKGLETADRAGRNDLKRAFQELLERTQGLLKAK